MYHWVKLMLTSGYTSCRQSTFVYLNLYRENKKTVRRGGMKRARERDNSRMEKERGHNSATKET